MIGQNKSSHEVFGGGRMGARSNELGFSLIELLVAVAVFSIGVLALLESQVSSVRASSMLQQRALAAIVAENQTAFFLSSGAAPQVGQYTGREAQMGTDLEWSARRSLVPGAGIMRQTVVVTDIEGIELSRLTAFRLVD